MLFAVSAPFRLHGRIWSYCKCSPSPSIASWSVMPQLRHRPPSRFQTCALTAFGIGSLARCAPLGGSGVCVVRGLSWNLVQCSRSDSASISLPHSGQRTLLSALAGPPCEWYLVLCPSSSPASTQMPHDGQAMSSTTVPGYAPDQRLSRVDRRFPSGQIGHEGALGPQTGQRLARCEAP